MNKSQTFCFCDCLPEKTCVNVTKNFDSINFSGKLTNVPLNYMAKLGDGSKIIFVFGKDQTIESTVKPTTINQKPTAETPPNSTAKTTTEPKTVPPEQTPSSGQSSGNENNGNGNEQETVPTTSSGGLIATSIVVVLLGVFAQILAQ